VTRIEVLLTGQNNKQNKQEVKSY